MADTPTPLQRTASEFPTDYWNDSCNESELRYAIDNGAVGATTNPTIVGTVMQQEYEVWAPRVHEIIAANPSWTDQQVTWQVIEEMAIRGWKMLEPIYQANHGQKGRLSIQIEPHAATARPSRWSSRRVTSTRWRPTCRSSSRPRRPASRPWSAVTEEGININATVSFTVPQALAVGEAMERALAKREAAGHDISWMAPVCTIMIGRTDDWVKAADKRDGITVASGRARVGRRRGLQASCSHLRRAWLPHASAGCRLPPSPALVGAHRRRRVDDHPVRLAAALQRLVGRGA